MERGRTMESAHLREYLRMVRKHDVADRCVFPGEWCGRRWDVPQRPVYRAATRALIERRGAPGREHPGGARRAAPSQPDFFQTQMQIIRSRPVIQRVIETMGLFGRKPGWHGPGIP